MIVRVDLGVVEFEIEALTAALVDRGLEEAAREARLRGIGQAFEQVEAEILGPRSCPECGENLKVTKTTRRTVVFCSGTARVASRTFSCACGFSTRPLESVLPRGRHSLAVVEQGLYLASMIGYERSAETLAHLTGAAISHGTLQRLAKAEAPRIDAPIAASTAALYETGLCPEERCARSAEDTVVVAMDGGFVPDRATRADFEAKVGVVWGARAHVSRGRVSLLDRIAYAGIEDAETFGRRMSVLAIESGMLSAGRTVVIGDGAGWIRRIARDVFPNAVYVLDLYHLKHRVRSVFPEEWEAPVREDAISACLAGDPRRALDILRRARPAPERADAHAALLVYVRNNSVGIANYTRTDLFGSGCVEKAVDVMVSRRFKLRGMSWLKPGAQGMVKLRTLRYNGTWDDHWGSRFTEAA
jgi:hypothetical protein